MTNEELVLQIQLEGDPCGELMLELWNQNQRFVSMIANKYKSMEDVEDLEMEGYIGLCSAVDKWKPGKPFLTYAYYWIRQSMIRYIEKDQNISINMQTKIRQLHKVESDFQQMHGREPSDAEISVILEISENELSEIRKAENKQNTLSLDAEQSVDDGDSYTLEELTPGTNDLELDVTEKVQQEQLAAIVWDEVDQLPEDQSEVIRGRFQQEKQLSEIAAESGRSVAQVEGDQRKGLTKLRTDPQSRKRLLPFWDDEIRSEGMKGTGPGSFARKWTSSTERVALKMYGRSE